MADTSYVKLGRANLPTLAIDLGNGSFADVVASQLYANGGVISNLNPVPISGVGPVTTMALNSGVPLAIDLSGFSGALVQVYGLSADTLKIETGMDIPGMHAATLLTYRSGSAVLQDATALTGSTGNGGWSVMGFMGELRFTRTGSADTLTVKVKGVN